MNRFDDISRDIAISEKVAYNWCDKHEKVYLKIFENVKDVLDVIEEKVYSHKEEFYNNECQGKYIAELKSTLQKLESTVKELREY